MARTLTGLGAITFVGMGAMVDSATVGATIAPALPGGTQAGDLALLFIVGAPDNLSEPAAPTGWYKVTTVWRELGADDLRASVYRKFLTGGDSSPNIVLPAGWDGGMGAAIGVWRGVEPGVAMDADPVTGQSAAAATWAAPGITSLHDKARIISFVATRDVNALGLLGGSEAGFTARASGGAYDTATATAFAMGVADNDKAVAGAVTMPTWQETINGNDDWVGISLALRPASAERAVLSGAHLNIHTKLEINDSDSVWRELTAMSRHDWLEKWTIDKSVQNPVDQARFTLRREIGSASYELEYLPGDSIAALGGVFSRADASTCATYIDQTGLLRTVAANVLRDDHWVNGVRHTLHEPARTNLVLRSCDAANAYWSKNRVTVTSDADIAPDGTMTADRIVEDSSASTSHFLNHTAVTITADATVAFSRWFKPGPRSWVMLKLQNTSGTAAVQCYFNLATGAIGSNSPVGTGTFVRAYTQLGFGVNAGWVRCVLVGSIGGGITSLQGVTFLATGNNGISFSGDGASYVTAWGAQIEGFNRASSTIITPGGSTVTRAADQLTFPIPAAIDGGSGENEFTVFAERTEQGESFESSFPRIWGIGEGGDAVHVRIREQVNSGQSQTNAVFSTADDSTSVSSSPAGALSFGDRHEFCMQVYADASVQAHKSINGGAIVAGARSAALAGGHQPWVGTRIGIGGAPSGTGLGSVAGGCFRAFRIAVGVKTLDAMRTPALRSVAPLFSGSIINRDASGAYVPLLDIARLVRFSVAEVANGVTPSSTDFHELFQGPVVEVDPAEDDDHIIIRALDLGQILNRTQIESEAQYGSSLGTAVQTVMQNIIDAVAPGTTLVTPVAPGWNILTYTQKRDALLQALRDLAGQIGWEVRYEYPVGSNTPELRFFQPPRTKTLVDWAFGPNEYLKLPSAPVSDDDVRNAATVRYVDPAGAVQSVTRTNAASIARYGRRWMLIGESETSNIDSNTEATAFGDAAVADLGTPAQEHEIETLLFWPIQLNDLCRFLSNSAHYDQDQDLAATTIRHEGQGGDARTIIGCRGKPMGAYADYLKSALAVAEGVKVVPPIAQMTYVSRNDTTETITLDAVVPGAGQTPVVWQTKLDEAGWSAVQTTALPTNVGVTRAEGWNQRFHLRVIQQDGQTSEISYSVPARVRSIDKTNGRTKRAEASDDGEYTVPSTTSDGRTIKDVVKVSTGVEGRRLLAKPLYSDPDTLDSVGDGSTYQRPLATALTSGQVDLSKGGVIQKHLTNMSRSSGDATLGSVIVQHIANTGHAASTMQESGGKPINKLLAKALAGDPDTLDSVGDGSTYQRPLATALTSGQIDLSKGGVIQKYLPNIARSSGDATTAGTILQHVANTGHAASTMQESGGKAINKLLAKALAADPDTADSLADGSVKRAIPLSTINGSGTLLTKVDGSAVVASTKFQSVAKRTGVFFTETFEESPSTQGWDNDGGSATEAIVSNAGYSSSGSSVLRVTGFLWRVFPYGLPFNPTKLYRIRTRIRHISGADSNDLAYVGVRCYLADGSVANSNGGYAYVGCAGAHINSTTSPSSTWIEFTGYFKGATYAYASGSPNYSTNPSAPQALNVDTVTIRPMVALNYNGGTNVVEIDYVTIEELDEAVSSRSASTVFGDSATKFPVVRHTENKSGVHTDSIGFTTSYEAAPEVYVTGADWTLPGASSTSDRRVEMKATGLTVSGCTLRAVVSTGSSSVPKSEDPASTLNGTTAASKTLDSDLEEAFWNLSNANATATTYKFNYDADFSGATGSGSAQVRVYRNDGTSSTSWTLVAQRSYVAGASFSGEQLQWTGAMDANWDFRILVDVPGGSGWLPGSYAVTVNACEYDKITAGSETSLTPGGSQIDVFAKEKS